MPNNGDTTTIKDERDGNEYSIAKINGQYWMTQNSRLTGGSGTLTLSSDLSNVSSYTMPAESTSHCTASNFSTDGRTCSNDMNTGCCYNYYSATGGTISSGSNSLTATSDICPKGWHLPSGPNITEGTDFNKLVGNTTSGWQITTGLTAFSGVAGGWYFNGSLRSTDYGYWWSSTADGASYRYGLGYKSDSGQFSRSSDYRYSGYFVRCMRD